MKDCLKTPYKDQITANLVIRKSELSARRNPSKPGVIREAYKCDCGFYHIRKCCAGVTNGFLAETGRFA